MEFALALVGATDVAVRASSKLWALSTAWRDAPVDLHNLRDDLTRTERFFGEIQEQLGATRIAASPLEKEALDHSELSRLIDEGAVALRRIEAIIDGLTVPDDVEQGKVGELGKKRKFLWLRHTRKIARLRKELGHIRSSICRLLIAQNMFMSSDIFNTLEHSHTEVRSTLNSLSASFSTSQDLLLTQLDHRIQAMEDRMVLAIHNKRSPEPKPQQLTRFEPGTYSPRRESTCAVKCICACHQVFSHLWRFTFLQSVAGMVAVAYFSRPNASCTDPSCLSSPSPGTYPTHDLYVTYHLPSWLARTSIYAFLTNNLNSSPAMNLRVYNRRSVDEGYTPLGVSRLIDQGDTSSLKNTLRTGQTSIYDLFDGQTGLALAFNILRCDMINLYLQSGADPFYRNDYGLSVAMSAFLIAFAGEGQSDIEKEAGGIFIANGVIQRYVEEMADFGALHRAVLAGADLGSMFAKKKEYHRELNNKGGEEWTALHLAAVKGDAQAARVLVRLGAEVDSPGGGMEVTPLYYACRYGHTDVVQVLLNAGADVHHRGAMGREAIHAASVSARAVDVLSMLLGAGAEVNSPNVVGYSPLVFAAVWGKPETVNFLLDHGADIGVVIKGEQSILMMAVRAACHENARVLLQRGAGLGMIDENGRSIVHLLATNGNEEMLRIFTREAEWKGCVGLAGKDEFGLTPLALFNERDASGEMRGAFERLLDVVEGVAERKGEDEVEGDLDEEDEFFDAEEWASSDGSERDLVWDTETLVVETELCA
ncbi:ankyrin repeat-containing domain protein [Immersiella caudata]|uniref:Ankyrin repeat-containing domain protein n=1 Tax=Immersiella caudata TaxID=314043 RepID=A0AA39WLQ2_9PEZI|nr:ankyrin repeat-containing domain protein [Immersiella caudata]